MCFTLYEIKRILKSRFTQIIILISACFPLLSLLIAKLMPSDFAFIFLGIGSYTTLSQVVLFPTKISAFLSVITFTALTVFEFDRMSKFKTDQIIKPISSPIKLSLNKILGLTIAGLISIAISMIIMLPHYIYTVGRLDIFKYYLISYICIIFLAIVFTILISAGFYLIFKHVNIIYIIMALAAVFSCFAGFIDYQYMWVQTGATGFSDYFGDSYTVLGIFWNRLYGFLISAGIFLIGLLCDRCYGKDVFGSCLKNCKKYILLPISIVLVFIGTGFVFKNEPIFNNISVGTFSTLFLGGNDNHAKINDNIINTSNILVDLDIDVKKNFARGISTQTLQNISDTAQTLRIEFANGYIIDDITLDNEKLNYKKISPKTTPRAKYKNILEITLPEKFSGTLRIKYCGCPKDLSVHKNFAYGINKDYVNLKDDVIPKVCNNKNDKMIEGKIKISSKLTLITQGSQNKKLNENGKTTTWSFLSENPDNISLQAGRYKTFQKDIDGTFVEFFYPELATEELKGRAADILDIFSYFSKNFGPFQQGNFKFVISSGTQGGEGAARGNISYASEDCLTKKINSENTQASNSDVFALLTHEIAHQWWGIGINVTNEGSNDEIDKKHDEWTDEAFAEMSTYLFFKDKFSRDYADKLLLTKWQNGTKELKRNFYYRNPEYVNILPSIPKRNVSLILKGDKMYALGPLEIYNVYKQIGEEDFFKAMKKVYEDCYDKKDKKFTFSDFLKATNVSEEVTINE